MHLTRSNFFFWLPSIVNLNIFYWGLAYSFFVVILYSCPPTLLFRQEIGDYSNGGSSPATLEPSFPVSHCPPQSAPGTSKVSTNSLRHWRVLPLQDTWSNYESYFWTPRTAECTDKLCDYTGVCCHFLLTQLWGRTEGHSPHPRCWMIPEANVETIHLRRAVLKGMEIMFRERLWFLEVLVVIWDLLSVNTGETPSRFKDENRHILFSF